MGNINGLTAKELKDYYDLLIKANDLQIETMLVAITEEINKRWKVRDVHKISTTPTGLNNTHPFRIERE